MPQKLSNNEQKYISVDKLQTTENKIWINMIKCLYDMQMLRFTMEFRETINHAPVIKKVAKFKYWRNQIFFITFLIHFYWRDKIWNKLGVKNNHFYYKKCYWNFFFFVEKKFWMFEKHENQCIVFLISQTKPTLW